jgi:hypothetical protein
VVNLIEASRAQLRIIQRFERCSLSAWALYAFRRSLRDGHGCFTFHTSR